jgi:NAD(P)-dependent dehydrogenase (short-subunit alcohol dehydrogenase family)
LVADELSGKVAIVTGGSSGMGAAIVERLEAAGAVCHAVSRRGPVKVDVSDRRAVDAFLQTLDRVDVLVCAAGDNVKERRLDQLTAEAWDHMLAVNLSGAFYFVEAALAKLRASRGHVVLISSVSAEWPDGSGPAYQASKAGLMALARAAGLEEHKNGVRFSVLYPGLTNTPLLAKRPVPPPPRVIEAMLLPTDVAEACFFIISMPRRAHVAELTILPSRLQTLGQTSVANPEPTAE